MTLAVAARAADARDLAEQLHWAQRQA